MFKLAQTYTDPRMKNFPSDFDVILARPSLRSFGCFDTGQADGGLVTAGKFVTVPDVLDNVSAYQTLNEAARPSRINNGILTYPVGRFDGVANTVYTAKPELDWSLPHSVVIVFKPDQTQPGVGHLYAKFSSATNCSRMYLAVNGTIYARRNTAEIARTGLTWGVPHIAISSINANNIRMRIDGVNAGSPVGYTTGPINTANAFSIGSTGGNQAGAQQFFKGDVYDVLLFQEAILDDVAFATALERHFRNLYGFAYTPGAGV